MNPLELELPILKPPRPATCRSGHAHGDRSADGLLQLLLNEQQQLTAVEQFSQEQDRGQLPLQAKYYSKLLPAGPPQAGQQYAFEVDLDRCSGCKACVAACHSLNGLDESETWRDVGLLMGGTSFNPVMQHVTTACHHCLEPACMTACPVNAYEKDPVTGIVRHLDDQCFGCQYCTLACPYEVPKYHGGKGIVRKCDMCADRLAVGEAPACVQACPHEAIAIRVVEVAQVRENAEADPFLPAAPEPHITLPTTTYKTSRVFPRNMLPVDYYAVSPRHPHWPLIVMLVLTQLSVGAFAVELWLEQTLSPAQGLAFRPVQAVVALIFGLTALASSILHLGRPQFAFRAVLGLTHSWLSREIVAFGAFAAFATLYACSVWLDGMSPQAQSALGFATVGFGLAGVFCSAMIYAFTQREFWSLGRTLSRFLLTAAILGVATTWLSLFFTRSIAAAGQEPALAASTARQLVQFLVAASGIKMLMEAATLRHLFDRTNTPLRRSAQLLVGPLSNSTLARCATCLLGGIVMPLFLLSQLDRTGESGGVPLAVIVSMIVAFCLIGELLERFQFFAAEASLRMPGGVR
jgi:Fe-S-cluster-containing dehydrogenase component/DMSO reductase anchor subunit